MYREIEIGGINTPMLATGSTPIRYKLIFKKDLLKEFDGLATDIGKSETLSELAFLMSMQAQAQDKKCDLNKLNFEAYINWLDQFEPYAIEYASDEIIDLYTANLTTTSEPKKKEQDGVKEK